MSTAPLPDVARGWMGAELAATPERWVRSLSAVESADLVDAAMTITDVDLATLDARTLAPPSTRLLADEIRNDLLGPLSFVLIRGLPVDDLDRSTVAAAFFLLGGLVGSPRSQNASGHLLGHVKDVGLDVGDGSTRIYQTNARQTFHTDSSDAVGLLCLRTARSGGQSLLASGATIYNRLRADRPDLARWLFDPVPTDRRGEVPDGARPWFEIPVLTWFEERLTVLYQRQYIDSATRFPEAPTLDARHKEALDAFDRIANDPEVHLAMDLEPGDMQFVHNHSLLHDRTSFTDDPDPARRRHLLRLWLSLPGDRLLPPVFADRYGSVTVGDRGGIRINRAPLVVPLDA